MREKCSKEGLEIYVMVYIFVELVTFAIFIAKRLLNSIYIYIYIYVFAFEYRYLYIYKSYIAYIHIYIYICVNIK